VADTQHEQPAYAGPQFDGVAGILELAGGEVTVSGRYWDTSRTGQYLPGRGSPDLVANPDCVLLSY
jgi:hypothetical protein